MFIEMRRSSSQQILDEIGCELQQLKMEQPPHTDIG